MNRWIACGEKSRVRCFVNRVAGDLAVAEAAMASLGSGSRTSGMGSSSFAGQNLLESIFANGGCVSAG